MIAAQNANCVHGEVSAPEAQNACLELGVGAQAIVVEVFPISADFQSEGPEIGKGSAKVIDAVDFSRVHRLLVAEVAELEYSQIQLVLERHELFKQSWKLQAVLDAENLQARRSDRVRQCRRDLCKFESRAARARSLKVCPQASGGPVRRGCCHMLEAHLFLRGTDRRKVGQNGGDLSQFRLGARAPGLRDVVCRKWTFGSCHSILEPRSCG